LTQERFFYHSFPRRGAHTEAETVEKGCQILAAIRDSGLLLMPEYIEFRQPSADGSSARVFPVLQQRVCFTELSPAELPQHAQAFGEFGLEFEIDTLRRLGAVPVSYIPQPTGTDGSGVATSLLAIAMDAQAVVNRMAALHRHLNGPTPIAETFELNLGFVRSPASRGRFVLARDTTKTVVSAIGHDLAPWEALDAGMYSLFSFFYPTDDTKRNKDLEYYRQREWRIACNFTVDRIPTLRELTESERERLLKIDRVFFERKVETDLGTFDSLSKALIHPGFGGKKLIEMARRVIVPAAATNLATQVLSSLENPPPLIAISDL
jgi:hypothetical protein